ARPGRGGWSAILAATLLLFLASLVAEPRSVSQSSVLGMLPFAAILAIAAVGETLVIQQGGIDLSVPGVMSITVVIVTHYPNGDSSRLLPALAISLVVALAAVGANAAAAAAAGVAVVRYRVGAYAAASVLYWSAAVLLAGVVTTPSVFQGNDYLLLAVAAVVLGGTSLLGGSGSTVASALGA